jgi:hypothetical protein
MPDDQEKQGFWTTLPGTLTRSAALVTAIAGLILGLYQNGAFGSKQGTVDQSTEVKGTTQILTPEAQSNQEPPVSTTNQKEREHYSSYRQNGKLATLCAHSFSLYEDGDQMSFHDGQSIPLNRIREIDVLGVIP